MTECVADKPVLVMTWTGQDPSLPAIMLNSHTDVVPGLTYQNERERQEEPNRAIEPDGGMVLLLVCEFDFELHSFPGALDLPTLFCPQR